MQRFWVVIALALSTHLLLTPPALAQGEQPTATSTPSGALSGPPLTLFTAYPDQIAGVDEALTFPLKLRTGSEAQVVRLEVTEAPEGWNVTFRGGGRAVQSAYVEPGVDTSVEMRLEAPADAAAGEYDFVVTASGDGTEAELPLSLTLQEQAPPSLSMNVELPTLRGRPSTTFRYNVTVQNDGAEDLVVNLGAEAPAGFVVTFDLSGQDVTDIPLAAGESKRLSVEARPRPDIQGGTYPINISAQGGGVQASADLVAEVSGEPTLSVTTPDGRLSAEIQDRAETPLQIVIRNSGTAPASDITLSASQPSGWTVTFNPERIDRIEAGAEMEVTANVRPSENAIAGDYVTTFTARTEDGISESAEFRITVLTSTLWGMWGVGLIALAVAVVGLAVMSFGRR